MKRLALIAILLAGCTHPPHDAAPTANGPAVPPATQPAVVAGATTEATAEIKTAAVVDPTAPKNRLAGTWRLHNSKRNFEVTFEPLGKNRYRLVYDRLLVYSGIYEVRGNEFVMVVPAMKYYTGFVWAFEGDGRLTLVNSEYYKGSTLTRADVGASEGGNGRGAVAEATTQRSFGAQ